ncbi:hypothetical protein ACFFX0_20060 [Citricoccus parietis]|uniref:Uncharacterized protein n=1 Tax=Citricoccus parietis TaxID=592307 RepID=A0ABV5G355_9MICC
MAPRLSYRVRAECSTEEARPRLPARRMLWPKAKLTRARRYGRCRPRRCPSAASKCSRASSGSPCAAVIRPRAQAIRARSDGTGFSRRMASKPVRNRSASSTLLVMTRALT